MRSRHVSSSNSSIASNEETDSFLPTLEVAYPLLSDSKQVLHYTVQVLLLEYINEPRFRKRLQKKTSDSLKKEQNRTPQMRSNNLRNKRASWLPNESGKSSSSDESKSLQRLLPLLEKYLMNVTIGITKLQNELFRRSVLKFYNDLFLNPQMTKVLQSMSSFEELIMLFTKAANGELTKLETPGTQVELYNEISSFIDVIIGLMPDKGALTPAFIEKLEQYKNAFEPSTKLSKVSSPSSTEGAYQGFVDMTVKPSFRVEEITHARYLIDIFNMSEIEFQQYVVRYIEIVKNDIYQAELENLKRQIREGKGTMTKRNFNSVESYEFWKSREISTIDLIIEKLEESKSGHNEKSGEKPSETSQIIPCNSKDIFTHLMWLILKKELSEAPDTSSSVSFSKDATFFFLKCSKYWRIDVPSTQATLLYTAANLGVLNGEELNPVNVTKLFGIINSKILHKEEDIDVIQWNSEDQKQWLINLTFTFKQIISSLKTLIAAIYDQPRPKFSPVLQIYYLYIEPDPLLTYYELRTTDFYKKYIKILRRTLFRASENHYVKLLEQVPRNNEIEMYHIQHIAESIVSEINSIQKKFSKPLLGELNLAFECANVLIEAFGTDSYTMLKRIEQYQNEKDQQDNIVLEAIETYAVLQELRNVFSQVQKNKKFPLKLEKFFVKYLSQLCDQSCDKMLQVVQNALLSETWEPVNSSNHFSTSAVDIFKMTNESIDMFSKLNWENEYQISKIYTFLLKAMADGLTKYATTVTNLVDNELTITPEDDVMDEKKKESNSGSFIPQSAAEKMKNTWIFSEMRNALRSSNIVVPKPYKFTRKTCVCLSNLDHILTMINDLEDRINPENISSIVNKYEKLNPKRKKMTALQNNSLKHLYAIKIIRADNCKSSSNNDLLNSSVSLVDTMRKQDIAKTRVVAKSAHPEWREEFEVEIPVNESRSLNVILWDHKSSIDSSSAQVCGRSTLQLDPRIYRDDGYPQDVLLNLDTRGKILLEVSMETEKVDALFSVGRAYRTIAKAHSRSIELIVSRFSSFVDFAFSRSTLKTVCGTNGNKKAESDVVYDAILPLFDYLNANLSVLALELSKELLHKVMLETWSTILNRADSLLLPFLSDVRKPSTKAGEARSIWENAMDAAMANLHNSSVFGRPLAQIEIDTIFEWLRALCIDFFHNNGEGPPLKDLKDQHYQNLLLIPIFYDKSITELKDEIEMLNPQYEEYLKLQNVHCIQTKAPVAQSRRKNTIARRKTILANSSKKRRMELEQEIKKFESNPLETAVATQDILLRILLAKGEVMYVYRNLRAREQVSRKLNTERFLKAAVSTDRV